MWKDFREFIQRGSVVDLAVGVVIGGAFGKIVTSFVNDILMPPIGLLLGRVDFANLFISLSGQPYATLEEAQAAGAATVNYGLFINTVIDFLIVSLMIFLMVRQINRMRRQQEVPPEEPTTKECPHCLSAIPLKATRCPFCTSDLGVV